MALNIYDDALEQLEGKPQPTEAPNPYDDLIRTMDAGKQQRLRTAVVQADETTPDRAAEVQSLSRRTGIAAPIIERNFDVIKKRNKFDEIPYSQMFDETPALAEWAAEPANAAVAADDLEPLGFLEWLVTAPGRGLARGVDQVRFGDLRAESLLRSLTQEEQDRLNSYKFGMQKGGALGAGESWFRGAIVGTATQLPNLFGASLEGVKTGAIGALTGAGIGGAGGALVGGVGAGPGAVAGAAFGFKAGFAAGAWKYAAKLEAGLAYDEYLDFRDEFGQPLEPGVAKAAALATGAINGGLELLAVEKLLKSIPGVKQLGSIGVKSAVKTALRNPSVRGALTSAVAGYGGVLTTEVATEVAQRAVTILSGELAKATDQAGQVPGQLEKGNIDLFAQPVVTNRDGTTSTVDSLSVNIDGREVLLPTVTPEGRHLEGPDQVIAEYKKTGKHLGIFETAAAATAFASQLHEDYAAGKYTGKSKFKTGAQIGEDLLAEAGGALQSFALLSLPGPVMQVVIDTQKAKRADQNVAFFNTLAAGVTQSKTVQRSPEAAQAFLERATRGGPLEAVYAPVETWTSYWQSKGLDPADVAADVIGSRDAYERALQTGVDLVIPTARYAVKLAGTEHNAFFANELRLAPDEMNTRESQAFAKAQQAQPAPAAEAVSPVRTAVLEQLTGIGLPAETAEAYADLYGSTFSSLAERAGLDEAELFERYGLAVERAGLTQSAVEKTVPIEPAAPISGEAVAEPQVPAGAAVVQPGVVTPAEGAVAEAEAIPGLEAMEAALERAQLEQVQPLDPEGDRLRTFALNASGESAASLEATRRQAGMRARGEAFVVYNRAGQRRRLIGPEAVDYQTQAGETYGVEGPSGFRTLDDRGGKVKTERAADAEVTEPPTGARPRDVTPEQPAADERGAGEGRGDGDRVKPRRFQTPDPDEVYERQPAAVTATRLTPEVTREVQRIFDELDNLRFVGRTWSWLEGAKTGSAAGGAAEIAPGAAGARVYHDVLFLAPPNKVGAKAARQARGTRAQVRSAAQTLAETGTVKNNLAEGVLRVAERRAAGEYFDIGPAELPPSWGTEASEELLEALSFAIDQGEQPADLLQEVTSEMLEPVGEVDTSFDVEEFNQSLFDDLELPDEQVDTLVTGEQQPRLPEAGAVREGEVATPEVAEAPFALTAEVSQRKGKQTTLFQGEALTPETLTAWIEDVKQRAGEGLAQFEVYLTNAGDLHLSALMIERGDQRAGLGTKVMRELTRLADLHGKRLTLKPGRRDSRWGTTSRARLVQFYSRFGFRENKGVDKDFRIDADAMVREPTVPTLPRREAGQAPATTLAALKAAGFDTSRVFFHQTSALNVEPIAREGFDLSKARARLSDEQVPDGVFLKPTEKNIGVGASGAGEDVAAQIPVYVRFGVTRTFADREALERHLSVDEEYKRLVSAAREYDKTQAVEFDRRWEKLRKLDAVNRDERAQHKADLEIDEFLEEWKRVNVEHATAARARATEFFRGEGVETVVIKNDKGSLGRATETVIAIGGQQLALAQAGQERILFQPDDLTGRRAEKRGAIRFGPDRQMTISLLEKADLSTFLHESGHFYLEVLGDVVGQLAAVDVTTLTPAQQQLLEDYGTILEWLKVDSRGAIGTEQHEQFARGFEAYLLEGKAPSVRLATAFYRFRAWLLGIYRSLKGLNVELSEPVRDVLDRLVASDKAIEEAEARRGVPAMFTTPEMAGMTPPEFGLYRKTVEGASRAAREQLDRKLLVEVTREQTKVWKEQRAAVALEIETEVNQRPVYRALSVMQKGTHPDGTPLVEGVEAEPVKLSKAILIQRFGEDRLKRLPRPYIYSAEGGVDPDIVATMFGYDSADALLTAVEQAPPRRAVIEQETKRRMLAEHGSILLDGTLQEQARTAIATEEQDAVIRAELRALGRLRRTVDPFVRQEREAGRRTLEDERAEREYERRWFEAEAKLRVAIAEGQKQVEIAALEKEVRNLRAKARGGAVYIRAALPSQEAVKASATERIAAMPIRSIRPDTFWSASRRAAVQAVERAARQDLDGAIAAKQQELVNVALFREAERMLEDANDRVKFARSLAGKPARARIGLAGENYLEQIDGILERFDLAPVSKKALERRVSLRKFAEGLESQGLPVDLPEEVLEEARRVNYQELSTQEFVGVTDALKAIAHLAGLKNRLLKQQKKQELDEVAAGLADSIREHAKGSRQPAERDRRVPVERGRLVEEFFASHRKLASLARQLDGFKDGGLMWEAIIRPLNAAGDREAELNAQATKALGELVEAAYPRGEKRALYEKQHIPAIGRSLSKMERLMVALNWGNEGNRDRVRRAEGWNDQQVQTILSTLDERDFEFVQGVFDFIDGYWSEIKAKQERVYGIAPEKVEASPINTPFGTQIAGGYFPLKYDDRLAAGAAAHLDLEAAGLAKQAAYAQATTKRGHTKERVSNVKLPVRLDFGVMFEHVRQVVHDLSHHEALIDVGRVLSHQAVQKAIYETHGDIIYKQFKNGVRDVAFGDIPATQAFERAINHVRTGATVAGLGWNLTTAFLQPIGLTQSMVRIGPGWVARGLYRWLRDAATMEHTGQWVNEKSALMRHRFQTQQREINEIRNSVGVSTGKFSGMADQVLGTLSFDLVTKQGIADSYFWMITRMQRVADMPTWLGQYEKSMEAGESEARAIALADQAVLDAQGGGQIKDLAGVQRGGPLMRLFTNFYSFFNTTLQLTAESTRRTNFKNPASVGRLAVDYLLLYTVPATLGYVLRAAMKGGEDEEGFLEGVLRDNATYILGSMIGLRELGATVQGYGYEGPAGLRVFSSASRLVQQTGQAIEKVAEGEPEEAFDAAFFRSLNDTAGMFLHYPAGQVWRSINGAAAIAEGKSENPGVLVAGVPRE